MLRTRRDFLSATAAAMTLSSALPALANSETPAAQAPASSSTYSAPGEIETIDIINLRELEAAARMIDDACRLLPHQRDRVEQQVAETCRFRGRILHAVNCRSNHLHVVVSATVPPKGIREQLKAWCSRRLNEQQRELGIPEEERRSNWWSERGSIRWIFTESDLAAAIDYVLNQQDNPQRYVR